MCTANGQDQTRTMLRWLLRKVNRVTLGPNHASSRGQEALTPSRYCTSVLIGWWVSNTQGSGVQDWAVIKRAKDTWQCCAGGKIHLVQFIIFGFGSWDITHIQSQNDRTNWIRGRKATENARSVGRKGPRNTRSLCFAPEINCMDPLNPTNCWSLKCQCLKPSL